MSINWKKPQEKRYKESRNRLYPLFCFIFLNLEKSDIQADLYKKKCGKEIGIKKKYDTCLLISLYILKLVVNLSDEINKSSKRETSKECTDEELLMVWYFAFNENFAEKRFINEIGESRRREIKTPEICNGFTDETKVEKIKSNNFNKYMRSIPKEIIHLCICRLLIICNSKKYRGTKIHRYFYDFLKNFINGMTIELPDDYKMLSLESDNFTYYFSKYRERYLGFWASLYRIYPKEVEKRMDEVRKKRSSKQKVWTNL